MSGLLLPQKPQFQRQKLLRPNRLSSIGDRLHDIIKRETGQAIPCGDCKREISRLNSMTASEVRGDRRNIVSTISDKAPEQAPKRWQRVAARFDRALKLGFVKRDVGHWVDEAIATGGSPMELRRRELWLPTREIARQPWKVKGYCPVCNRRKTRCCCPAPSSTTLSSSITSISSIQQTDCALCPQGAAKFYHVTGVSDGDSCPACSLFADNILGPCELGISLPGDDPEVCDLGCSYSIPGTCLCGDGQVSLNANVQLGISIDHGAVSGTFQISTGLIPCGQGNVWTWAQAYDVTSYSCLGSIGLSLLIEQTGCFDTNGNERNCCPDSDGDCFTGVCSGTPVLIPV